MAFRKILSNIKSSNIPTFPKSGFATHQHSLTTADICEKLLPSVFRIMVLSPKTNMLMGLGSGFFIKPDGTAITSYHVLGPQYNMVARLDNDEEIEASLIHYHKQTDIAIINVQVNEKVPYVEFGDSNKLRRGQGVIHMGATYISDHNDFDIGWVNRVKVETPQWLESYLPSDISPADSGLHFIKTTGFMRSGYSGGPLVNLEGQVVGLTTKVFVESHKTGPEVEGASIPINFVKTIVDQLETKGKVERPFIGLSFVPTSMGLVVTHIQNDTPAQKAGIQPGDILVFAENTALQNAEDLYRVIGFQPGSTINVKAQRGGDAHVIDFKIQT